MNRKPIITTAILSGIIFAVYIAFLVITNLMLTGIHKPIIIGMGSLFVAVDFGLLFGGYFLIKKRREEIKRSFDFYVEQLISVAGVGMISFNDDGEIIFVSQFVASRWRKNIIGKKLKTISKEFEEKYTSGKKIFRFEIEGITYEANVNFENKVIVIKDVSNEAIIMQQYATEKLVLAELEIDNFQQFQITLPEEEIFRLQSQVMKMLDELVEKYNLIYRQYVNGKYILIMNQETLDKFVAKRFNFLDKLRQTNVVDGIKLSASIGVGSGSSMQRELMELAKDGLMQAQSRGGDQVGLLVANRKPSFYGSKNEIAKTVSRVKIKQITGILEKRLVESRAKRVVIYGHAHADLDAIGAGLGIAALAKTYGLQAYIQNVSYDNTTAKAIDITLSDEEKSMFIKPSRAQKLEQMKGTLAVIVDVADLKRIENPRALVHLDPEDVFIFDHHRVSKIPSAVSQTNSYIDTSASSASEIVVEVIQFVRSSVKMPKGTAQMLLNGIYLDTNQFHKATSSRTFQAAAFLEKNGASSAQSTDVLKLSEMDSRIVNQIVSHAQEVKPGYFIASYQGEAGSDVVSIAADEILRTSGRRAAFVVAKIPGRKEFKMSARSIDTNVQVIAEMVGGGGHFGAAAAVSGETLSVFSDNIIQAIISVKDGK